MRKAYRQLCLTWHPDKHASSKDDQRERARHKFTRIQAAYETLAKQTKQNANVHRPSPYDYGEYGQDNPFRRSRSS